MQIDEMCWQKQLKAEWVSDLNKVENTCICDIMYLIVGFQLEQENAYQPQGVSFIIHLTVILARN